MYDAKCLELAEDFLEELPSLNTQPRRDELAQRIQDIIEDTVGDWLEQLEGAANERS